MVAKIFVGKEELELPNHSCAKINYYILKEKKYYEEVDIQKETYGIEIEKIVSQEVENSILEDITCDISKIQYMIVLLKRNQVTPVHLKEVVEDLIGRFGD